MAQLTQRRPENVAGDFYVDQTCIDCDTCRWMAPEIFTELADQSVVYHQPTSPDERLRAMQALLSCPTASIGTFAKPIDIRQAQASLPTLLAPTVYHCGYHAENSFGAASYLVLRPEGNLLIDSPRFAPPLVKQLEQLGGIRYLYLTHRDDVADHQKFQQHFGCERILHQDDLTEGTQSIERKLIGQEPIQLAPDLLILPVPGHTRGHTVLLYDQRVLFTGDHLAWSPRLQHLHAFRTACLYSWPIQIESMQRLADWLDEFSFEWVLPGHGRRFQSDRDSMRQQMQQCLAWMRSQ